MKFEKNPSHKYRSLPFWSLNGKLDEKELRAQIGVLKNMGFGGAFIHSRTGLKTEYMGSEWLRLTSACADECAREGVDAWLYDEDRWPSGTCGGYVTEDPRYRLRFISAEICERDKFDLHNFGDEFIAAFAIKLTGEEFKEYTENMPRYSGMRLKDYFPVHNRYEIPEGYLGMTFKVELMQPEEFYNDFTYADTMNAEATARFIELTHQKYRDAMGERFGKSIQGIFTDEPHRGALLSGFGIANKNALRMLPYTAELPSAYAEIWGENVFATLPELYFGTKDDNFSRAMWKYVETLQQLFIENFARPVNEWCKNNNLILTGHVLHEDTLSAQTTMSGSVMRYYEQMGYPGMDNLGSENTCFQAAVAVSSVAKQTGKKFVLSELYGCSGWKTTFEEYKQMGDWQAAFGVNLRCPHLSWYTMKGEAKRDYPASINKQANWHNEYRAVEDYFARLGYTLSKSKPVTDTLVVMPVESAWGLTHLGTYVNSFGVRDGEYARLERSFTNLTESLVFEGVDFDYGDEDMISRLASVGSDENGAYIKLGKMKYRKAVLPYMITVRSSTLGILADFVEIGGKASVCGELPTHVDGEKAEITFGIPVLSIEDLTRELKKDNIVCVESDGKFFGALKKSGKDEYVYFVVNHDRENAHGATVKLKGEYNVEKFNLRNGETEGIEYSYENGYTVVKYCFDKSEELLLHFTHGKTAKFKPYNKSEPVILGDKPVKYKLDRLNALVLDRANAYVNGEFFAHEEILRLDVMLRDKFGLRHRSGSMVQPWYKEKFFGGYDKTVCRLALEFEFEADYIPLNARLMAEDADKLSLSLNGRLLNGNFEKSDIDECYLTLGIASEYFSLGKNVLRVELDFADSFDLENMFILGSFGVTAGCPCRITALPERLALSDVTKQGLPFYAGTVTYLFECEDGEYNVTVPDFYAACLKTANGVCAFAPFTMPVKVQNGVMEVSAALTPKNMFGPLHELPVITQSSGPWNYRTGGNSWSDGYALLPQGILAPVKAEKAD